MQRKPGQRVAIGISFGTKQIENTRKRKRQVEQIGQRASSKRLTSLLIGDLNISIIIANLKEENLTLKTKLITLEESHTLNQNQTG